MLILIFDPSVKMELAEILVVKVLPKFDIDNTQQNILDAVQNAWVKK